MNANPDIVTNVYRDDEWFMNRHRPDEMRFQRGGILTTRCLRPALSRRGDQQKCFSPATLAVDAPLGRRLTRASLGRSGKRELLYANLSGSDGGRVSEGLCAGSGRSERGVQPEECIAFGDGMVRR